MNDVAIPFVVIRFDATHLPSVQFAANFSLGMFHNILIIIIQSHRQLIHMDAVAKSTYHMAYGIAHV